MYLLRLKPKCIHQPNQILAQLITRGLTSPTILANLTEKYCSISSPRQAQSLFTHFHHPSLFLFNTLIRCNQPNASIKLFASCVSDAHLVFDEFSYTYILGSCARSRSLSALWFGRQLHGRILRLGYVSDLIVGTTLIHFYGSGGNICLGRKMFDEMPDRSVATWNALLSGYCSTGSKGKQFARAGVSLFREMYAGACQARPNGTTVVSVLSACAQLSMIELGACVHGYIEKMMSVPEGDVYVGTALVDMYSKCGCLAKASDVFNQMKNRNVFTWTALVTGLALHGKGEEASRVLDAMYACGVKPNAVTFTSLFSACCHSGLINEGLYLFRNMRVKYGVTPQIQHYGCIVQLLGKAGHLREAYQIIMEMPREPDAVLWRILLNASEIHGDVDLGERIGRILLKFQSDQTSREPDDLSEDYVALSNVYASSGKWDEVERVRKEMKIKRIGTRPGASYILNN